MGTNRNVILAVVVIILIIAGVAAFAMLRNNNQAIESAQQNSGNQNLSNNGNSMDMNMNMDTNVNSVTNSPTNNTNGPVGNTNGNANNSNNNTNNQGTVKTFNVTGQNFSFSPAQITVNKGDKVKIVFTSKGGTHDWMLDEFNAHTQLVSDGQTAEVQFTADKAGTFQFYCSVGNHRQMGMVGNLVVK